MALFVTFPSDTQLTAPQLGGKGYALLKMSSYGFSVPPGVILTTEFFTPWFDQIKKSSAWAQLSNSEAESWNSCCQKLQALSYKLPLTAEQEAVIIELQKTLTEQGDKFAVRSSSPDEDLLSYSFAGGYETKLGVGLAHIEDAVRHCFASSLDRRVFIYKQQNGFDILAPNIAVIIQQQIASESAGVAFSLNPSTNDYDEMVVNANWGLGESVVAGHTTPDLFVFDKIKHRIIEKVIGSKESAIKLKSTLGTEIYKDSRNKESSLSELQLIQLSEAVCQIEAFFGYPVDVEWAYHQDHLYILQARPITTYIPIAEEMQTKPGERRLLYGDAALSKGMATNSPMSPMEFDWNVKFFTSFVQKYFKLELTPKDGIIFFASSRMYINYSNLLWFTSLKKMSKANAANDVLLGDILASIDQTQYRTEKRPQWITISLLWRIPKVFWLARRCIGNVLAALVFPKKAHGSYLKSVATYQELFSVDLDYTLPISDFQQYYSKPMWQAVFNRSVAALTAGLIAQEIIKFTVGKKQPKLLSLVDKMQYGFSGNIVVNMGIAIYNLAKQIDPNEFNDIEVLSQRVTERKMSKQFMQDWDEFIVQYGCRGPEEMDVASPRYADNPSMALTQMSFMVANDNQFDPYQAHCSQIQQRKNALNELLQHLGWFKRKIVLYMEYVSSLFIGARDTPKHQIVMYKHALRRRLLLEAKNLIKAGRLLSVEQIFDLIPTDLENSKHCLQQIRMKRTQFVNQLRKQVKDFPQVIDSRGRIHRPLQTCDDANQLKGMPVSPGYVSGPVKVLNSPNEKPIETGDILIAYSTDPGWTPLFVSAAAIILEVGGVLQHGAVVAREYGKPCVAGISQVTTKLKDGQRVEVNGSTGIVRILPEL